jgi:hypothetical protein
MIDRLDALETASEDLQIEVSVAHARLLWLEAAVGALLAPPQELLP